MTAPATSRSAPAPGPAATASPTPRRAGLLPYAVEDRREVRRRDATRVLLLVGVVAWTSVAAWWAVYFHRANAAVREATLATLTAEARLAAQRLAQGEEGTLPATLELAPFPLDADAGAYPSAVVEREHVRVMAVVVAPAERRRLEAEARKKALMLAGEGSLLIGLLFVIHFALYRMLAIEWRLNRQRDAFVHAVTHELRSPIAGLRALLQSFQALELEPRERAAFVELGIGELTRLDGMVGNILLSARLEGRGFTPNLAAITPASLVANLVERRRPLFADKGGAVSVDAAPVEVRFDAEAFETIVGNLLDNALKYGGPAPEVRVCVRRAGRRVEVEVQDHGVGLAADELPHVFEKFYRAPGGERAVAKGSGLGLFIARGLARACGGELSVSSDGPGRGCRFVLAMQV